jgi:uncharacterized membrane protein YdjX (TVP38/TMEM64 family)
MSFHFPLIMSLKQVILISLIPIYPFSFLTCAFGFT